jgi:hypothetical protein
MRSFRWLVTAAVLLSAAPSFAATLQVLGWQAGESINVAFNGSSRSVLTAHFQELLDGVAGSSFCVDLSQYINRGSFSDFVVYDPTAAEGEAFADGPPQREFTFAAQIVNAWANNIGALASQLGVSEVQVVTGVQAAVWEAVYGDAFAVNAMSDGAKSVYDFVLGRQYDGYGATVLLYSRTRQDQMFTPPVPEPSAVLLFGAGVLLVGRSLRRRLQA